MSGRANHLLLAGDDVVGEVRVHRRRYFGHARLHVRHELHQSAQVVALGKPLPLRKPSRLELALRPEEAVGRHEIDPGVARPARKQCLEHARGGALSHRHAPGQTDHVGHARAVGADEGGGRPMEALHRADVEIQQARQRQVDVGHFVERHPLVEADEPAELRFGQRQRRRVAEGRPLGAAEFHEARHDGQGHRAFTSS